MLSVFTVSLSLYVVAYLNMALYSLQNAISFPTTYLTTYLSSIVPCSCYQALMAFTRQVLSSWKAKLSLLSLILCHLRAVHLWGNDLVMTVKGHPTNHLFHSASSWIYRSSTELNSLVNKDGFEPSATITNAYRNCHPSTKRVLTPTRRAC